MIFYYIIYYGMWYFIIKNMYAAFASADTSSLTTAIGLLFLMIVIVFPIWTNGDQENRET